MIDPLLLKLERRDEVSPRERLALGEVLGPTRRVSPGTNLVHEGARPDHSTLLLEGFCARYSTLEDGGRQITQIGVPGDFLDLHSLLMKQMDHGVVALTDALVCPAPHAALRALTEAHPHLTRLLWLDTVIDGAIHRQWLVAMGRRSALARMAHLLCELYHRLEAVGAAGDGRMNLPLTQVVVADILGLSGVHVSRVLGELRDRGLVRWSTPTVDILRPEELRVLADFDPTYLRLHREPV